MALSNRATPKYYGEFRDKVLSGEIPVCREIAMEMERIDALIANRNIYYDPEAVEGWVLYCEKELTLTDGSDLQLLDSFKLWGEQIFCWWYFVERSVPVPATPLVKAHFETRSVRKRLTNKQYLIVARGAAKSLYESCLQSYFLVIDTTATHQITTAPTMKQAEEIMGPIRTSLVRARGPLFKFLTEGSLQNTTGPRALRQKLVPTKKGVENFLTGSLLEIRPMAINKLQGLRTKMNTVDEWLSGDLREDVIGAIEQGASKVDDYLIVAVSSEGTVRNGSGDTIKLELQDILRGDYIAPHVSIFHYKLDDIKEVDQPEMWPKANPNIGITISYEAYHLDVERAKKAPASRNDILAKRFGIPMEGYTYFFTYDETVPHRRREFDGMQAALGADLSQGDDFCAFTFLFPASRGQFGIKCLSFITQLTFDKLPGALRHKYQQFIEEGSLHVLDGTILDVDGQVFDELIKYIDKHQFSIDAFGYDPYGATAFINRWEAENGPFGIVKVPQGSRTESIPLGELKKLSSERLLVFDQLIMQYCMGNAITLEDTNGNRKLLKKRSDEKIDNVSALMDGFVAFKQLKEAFE